MRDRAATYAREGPHDRMGNSRSRRQSYARPCGDVIERGELTASKGRKWICEHASLF
jgi:hypothetical protein